jgi:hypothetical protein
MQGRIVGAASRSATRLSEDSAADAGLAEVARVSLSALKIAAEKHDQIVRLDR